MKRQNVIAVPVLLASLLLAGCTDESPEKRIASAKQYLQKNDNKSAVIEIKNALQKNPDLGEARFLLGSTLLKEGNVVAAEVEFRKALALKYPEDIVVPDLARAMLVLGQAKKVVDEFGNSRFGKPAADASLQTTLAAAYGALGKPEVAQAALTAALAADPKYAPALLASSRQKAVTRDFSGAMAIVDDVIGREPGNADAWKLKGDILIFALNKPDDGIAAYRKAIDANAINFSAHAAVLTVLLQQGKLDEAGKQLDQLKMFAARSPQTQYFEAQLAYQRKDLKRARELSQQLMQSAPNNARVLQLAGAVELQLGAAAQAEIYLSRATQLAPELALARRLLIVAYLRSGQPAKALTAMSAAAGKDGLDPALYTLAGEVYLQNGDAKKAEEYFAKALKLDPDNARKRTALAITHLAAGQSVAAIDELQNIAGSDAGTTADLALISAHLRRKEFDKALAAIDRLEAKQPEKPLAANLRGRVQLARKDNAAARKSFERALMIDPSYLAAAASLAALDMTDNKPNDAKKRFEGLLAKNPKNGQALLALAQLAAATGAGKNEIAALLVNAVDANPTDVAPRLMLIELHLSNKDNKLALATAQDAMAVVPASPDLLGALGRVQQVSGDVNQAIATYSKLVALQPLSPFPLVRLAEAHVANKDNRAAEQSLRKALEIKPDFLDAQRGLIIIAAKARMYPDAIKIARRVQEQRPKTGIGLELEGDINVARKDWGAATTAYRAALQLSASTDRAMKSHGAIVEHGKTKEAEQFAASWMATHPKDARFPSYLASVAINRKDYPSAEKLYLGVLQLQPDSAQALNNMAWVKHQLQKDGALAYAEKANQLVPNQPEFMDTLAMLLSARGDHAKAIDMQSRALTLQPDNHSLKLNLARIYIAAGDKSRAKTELDALARLGDKYSGQRDVTALLKVL